MAAFPALQQYRAVWRIPGGPMLLLGGALGRLGIAMTPLALLLLIAQVTGRYTPGAVAGGVYAVAGALACPVAGRIADRVGPAPVLLATAVAHPVALVVLVYGVTRLPMPTVWLLSGLAGATYPPLSAALRGAWNALTAPDSGRHHLRAAALAAETTLLEVVFVLGPLLIAGFVAVASPGAGLLAVAVATLVGTGAVARGEAMRGWRPHPPDTRARGLGPLAVPGFAALLLCVSGLAIAFGAMGVAVPAFATTHYGSDAGGIGGVLLALGGLGSAAGGFWFGTRRFGAPLRAQFSWLLGGVAASMAVLAVMPNGMALGVALLIGGATIAPALTVENAMVGHIAPPSMVNEAYTWVTTVAVGASAIGAAAAGPIVDRPGGVPWAFLLAGAATGAGALLAAWPGGPLTRADTGTPVQRTLAEEPA